MTDCIMVVFVFCRGEVYGGGEVLGCGGVLLDKGEGRLRFFAVVV